MNSREEFLKNPLFEGFSDSNYQQLLNLIHETRTLYAGDVLIEEGDEANEVYIIEEGQIEISVKSNQNDTAYPIATLGSGECIGELALMDQGKRSATARSVTTSKVAIIRIDDLSATSKGEVKSIFTILTLNLSKMLAKRMRNGNEDAIFNLEKMLEESEKRVEMGKFMSRVLIGTCLYIYALATLRTYGEAFGNTTFVTAPMLLAYAIGLAFNIKTSIYPMSEYGFNLRNWRVAIKDSLLFSLVVLVLIVLVKWIMVNNLPSMAGFPIFDFYRSESVSFQATIIGLLAYAVFIPVQEMIARSGIQSSFDMFLSGKYKTWVSIFLSTLVFSSTHLHVSFLLALLVFPLGLFWGWLYARHPTLLAPAVSHILIGCISYYVIGFPVH